MLGLSLHTHGSVAPVDPSERVELIGRDRFPRPDRDKLVLAVSVISTYTTEKGCGVGKLLWHTLMSLDGFIAGPNDDMSWAFGLDADRVRRPTGFSPQPERSWSAGEHRTWRIACSPVLRWRLPGAVLRVATRPPPEPPVVKGVTGVPGRRYRGGGDHRQGRGRRRRRCRPRRNIARQCLEKGLLDEIIVHVAPVLLGAASGCSSALAASRSSSIRSRRSTRAG